MTQQRLQIFTGEPVARVEDVLKGGRPAFPDGFTDTPDFDLVSRGARSRVVFREEAPEGFSVLTVRLGAEAIVWRHFHNTACLYFVTEGEVHLGARVVEPGGGFYTAAYQPYTYRAGPNGATVVEVRHATTFDNTVTETRLPAIIENARAHVDEWDAYFDASPDGDAVSDIS